MQYILFLFFYSSNHQTLLTETFNYFFPLFFRLSFHFFHILFPLNFLSFLSNNAGVNTLISVMNETSKIKLTKLISNPKKAKDFNVLFFSEKFHLRRRSLGRVQIKLYSFKINEVNFKPSKYKKIKYWNQNLCNVVYLNVKY